MGSTLQEREQAAEGLKLFGGVKPPEAVPVRLVIAKRPALAVFWTVAQAAEIPPGAVGLPRLPGVFLVAGWED